ncbi:MAG: transpeptidase family protein [Spirochaetes bacterium]|nr:transpeptidase family protein [Spirochaetota bacterium]
MKKNTFGTRKKIFLISTSLIVLFIIFNYMSIMLFRSESSQESASARINRATGERGPILDRNGRILAIQTRLQSVTAWIPSIRDVEKTAFILSEALDMDKNQLIRDISSRPGRFMYIRRQISNTEAERLRVHLDARELPGIRLEPEYGRVYPGKNIASHIIGYAGIDNVGLAGIEYTFNNVLSPAPSLFSGRRRNVYGSQVFLTIDLNIQHFAHQAASEAFERYAPEMIILIVAEAKTGEILGYVSIPEIDLSNFASAPASSRRNHPVATAFEPGSVFKVFSIASLLELGGINERTLFRCNGFFEISTDLLNPIRIRCLGHHGNVNAERIIADSCNAGAAYASLTASDAMFYQMLRLFGFGEPTGIPLAGETRGILRNHRAWSVRSKPTIAMGQEISVSAMQVVRAATVFANNGVMLQPRIVSKIISHDGRTIERTTREPIRQVISPQTAGAVLDMMSMAAIDGTGRRASVRGITMAVKTGTSQILDMATGRYSETDFIASCLALFPAEDPKIIIYTAIYRPTRVSHFGGVIAAPLVAEVAEQVISYLGIPRRGDTIIDHPGRIVVTQPETLVLGRYIPDFSGMSKRQILPILGDQRVRVLINGEGWVSRQSPAPGTEIRDGMTIELLFQ